jgi:hypothetical protein
MKRIVLMIMLFAPPIHAQQRPRPEVKATFGWVGFIDEDWIDHAMIGGAARFYVTDWREAVRHAKSFIAPEFRLGFETILRTGASIGFVF